jgi:hypothetical protein
MARKTRITAVVVALAAVVAMFVVTASASAFTFTTVFENWRVTGSLTDKKLNQTIVFPEGTFNGEAEIELPALTGAVSGTTAIPTFETTIKLFGLPAAVQVSFVQVGSVNGSIAGTAGCEERPACVDLSVPTKVNLVLKNLKILGLTIPETCETSEPGLLALNDVLTVTELASVGSHFTGTTKIATIKCNGFLGFLNGPILTSVMSGPENPYAINLAPPA